LEQTNKQYDTDSLIKIYIHDIINIQEIYDLEFENIIKSLLKYFSNTLQKRISIDDNKEIFQLLENNRIIFTENKRQTEILKSIT